MKLQSDARAETFRIKYLGRTDRPLVGINPATFIRTLEEKQKNLHFFLGDRNASFFDDNSPEKFPARARNIRRARFVYTGCS